MDNIEEIIIRKKTTDPQILKETRLVNISDYQQSLLGRVGSLRQWLNEDRITDNKKMVTNEDIKFWLGLDQVEELIKEDM